MCVKEVQAIIEASKTVDDAVLVLCHGEPISSPADAQFMLDRCSAWTGSTEPVRWSGCRPRRH